MRRNKSLPRVADERSVVGGRPTRRAVPDAWWRCTGVCGIWIGVSGSFYCKRPEDVVLRWVWWAELLFLAGSGLAGGSGSSDERGAQGFSPADAPKPDRGSRLLGWDLYAAHKAL